MLHLSGREAVTGAIIRLEPLATISGRILDEDGEPVRGSNVRAYRRGYSRGERTLVDVTATVSDAFGEFKVTAGAGSYYLAAIPSR